jgi:hypothetical protein
MSQVNGFVGANVREYIFLGTSVNSVMQQLDSGLRQRIAHCMRERHMGVMRLYASHVSLEADACIDLMLSGLRLLDAEGIKAIIVLDDSLGHSGFYVKGTEEFHVEGAYGHLNCQYYQSKSYDGAYRRFVSEMVDATSNHPAVIGYELANECSLSSPTESQCAAFLEYAHMAAAWLRERTDRLLLSGLISTRNVFRDPRPGETESEYARARWDFAVELYSALDAGSVHYYLGDESKSYVDFDIDVFAGIDKPYFVTEFGAAHDYPDRPSAYHQEMLEQRHKGASHVLVWSFSPEREPADEWGISPKYGDYAALCDVIDRANRGVVTPLPVRALRPPTPAVRVSETGGALETPSSRLPAPPMPAERHSVSTVPLVEKLTYLEDLTIPDGTRVVCGQTMETKRWLIRNDGNAAWSGGYRLVHVSGERLGAASEVALPPLGPNETGEVQVDGLVAPHITGPVVSEWRPCSHAGEVFRSKLTIEVVVLPEAATITERFPCPIPGHWGTGWDFGDSVNYTNDGKHHGVDFPAPKGKAVFAISNAYVMFSQMCSECTENMPSVQHHIEAGKDVGNPFSNTAWNWGFGHLVVLRLAWDDLARTAQRALSEVGLEGGYLYALYAHLSSIDARAVKDSLIAAGAKVGEVGETGNADGPHLHFELRAGARGDTWAATNTVLINPLAVTSEY